MTDSQCCAAETNTTIVKVKVAQSCPTLCNPMNYTVHGILQARILEWVAFPFSRGSSQPRDWAQVSRIAGGFFINWATKPNPRIPEWAAYPFSSGSSQPRNQTQVSYIAGRFFTNWPIREDQKHVKIKVAQLCPTLCNPMDISRLKYQSG